MTKKEIIIIANKINYLLSTYNYYLTEDSTQEAYSKYNEALFIRGMARDLGVNIEFIKIDVETEQSIYDYVAYIQIIMKNGDVMINWVCGCNIDVDNATTKAMQKAVNSWLSFSDVNVFWTDADNTLHYYEKFVL